MKIDDAKIDQNVKSNKKSIFFKSRDEDLAQNFENLNIN